jgi:transketolase
MIPFMTMRACEQVRTAICYQNLPVRLIGTGGGPNIRRRGVLHITAQWKMLRIMRTLVYMTVISIARIRTDSDLLEKSMTYHRTNVIRLPAGKEGPGDHIRATVGCPMKSVKRAL